MNIEGLMSLDAKLSAGLRLKPEARIGWKIAAFLAHSGDSWFWVPAMGIVWLFSWGTDWHRRSALIAIGVVALAFFVLGIKFVIRRQRPPGEWGSIYRNTDPHSFPSGHAARAGFLAFLTLGLGPGWFAIAVILWAPVMSLARVITGVHYLSDIVAGLLFGLFAGWLFLQVSPLLILIFPWIF
jgi:membrane-associated phospholipid phosphatase